MSWKYAMALEPMRDAVFDCLRGHVEPDREIQWGAMPLQNTLEGFGLRNRARKTVEDEAVRAVQANPVFNQFDDDHVRDELAVFRVFRRLNSQQRPEFDFPSQDGAC